MVDPNSIMKKRNTLAIRVSLGLHVPCVLDWIAFLCFVNSDRKYGSYAIIITVFI